MLGACGCLASDLSRATRRENEIARGPEMGVSHDHRNPL